MFAWPFACMFRPPVLQYVVFVMRTSRHVVMWCDTWRWKRIICLIACFSIMWLIYGLISFRVSIQERSPSRVYWRHLRRLSGSTVIVCSVFCNVGFKPLLPSARLCKVERTSQLLKTGSSTNLAQEEFLKALRTIWHFSLLSWSFWPCWHRLLQAEVKMYNFMISAHDPQQTVICTVWS